MHPRRHRPWLDVVVVYAVILALSSVRGEDLAGTPGWLAVVGHAAGYALLAIAIHRAAGGRSAGAVAVALAVTLGVLNEIQQGFVPGRSPDVTDVAVDGLGALAGVLVRSLGGRLGLIPRPVARPVSSRRPGSRPPGRGSAARR